MKWPVRETQTISDVIYVDTPRLLLPVSRVEQLQVMRTLSQILTLTGGLIAGWNWQSEYLILGMLMIFSGLVVEYYGVHRVIRKWTKSKQRATVQIRWEKRARLERKKPKRSEEN